MTPTVIAYSRAQRHAGRDADRDADGQPGALADRDDRCACLGDCNGDGVVTIDELVLGVDIALGDQPISDVRRSTATAAAR